MGVEAVLYPAAELTFGVMRSSSREYEQQRLSVLGRLASGCLDCVVASAEAAAQLTIPPDVLLDNTLDGVVALRFVDELRSRCECRVEFENRVVDLAQRIAHTLAVELCGIAQDRDLCLGCKLIAQGYCIVDNRLEIGMHRRLAIASKCYHIGHSTLLAHLGKHRAQRLADILACIETRSLGTVVVIPATLTVDTVEVAQLRLEWQEIDS
jgi:hypothetical protein